MLLLPMSLLLLYSLCLARGEGESGSGGVGHSCVGGPRNWRGDALPRAGVEV